MSTKHTPGPWRYDDTWGLIVARGEVEVAACHGGGSRSEAQANARLISAAPELLDALKTLLAYHGETGHGVFKSTKGHYVKERECLQCTMARAAIAKAEGREP
jgi:hypothetical protein